MDKSFDELFDDAIKADFSGWDFGFTKGRIENEPLPWDYEQIVDEYLPNSQVMLDMGTGGGELLEKILDHNSQRTPNRVDATEGWAPNVPIAQKRLKKFGVKVIHISDPNKLKLDGVRSNRYDLVINRHEAFDPKELARIMLPNKVFITQQVSGKNNNDINHFFGDFNHDERDWELDKAVAQLEKTGFKIQRAENYIGVAKFKDVGALVYYLKAIPWQIPGFDVKKNKSKFLKVHEIIQKNGYFASHEERFLIIAKNKRSK